MQLCAASRRRLARWVASAILLGALTPLSARAATKTWQGGTTAWGTSSNWSPSGAPGSTDDVVFVSTQNNPVSITSNVSIKSLTVNASYTAAITFGAVDVDISGDVTINGACTFTAPGGRLAIGGTFTKNAGTFTHNNGTVILKSTSNKSHTFGGATFSDLAINDGLIGYWKLDDTGTLGSGSIDDSSGYYFTLDGNGTPTSSSGHASTIFYNPRSVAMAKASSQYLSLGYLDTVLQPTTWTLSAWVKVTSLGTSGSEVITGGNRYMLRLIDGTGTNVRVETIMYDGTTYDKADSADNSTMATGDGKWHHVVAVNDGTNLYAWLDGTAVSASLAGASQSYTGFNDDFRLGAHPTSASFYFDGLMDEVRVYNRALTSGEILALYAGTQPGTGSATHTANDAVSVASSLFLPSGTFAAGSNSVTVGGSWLNGGGLFTSSGTVTLNGTTTGLELLSNGQRFNNLTINGSGGGWTLRDRLWVAGTLAISNGTLDSGGYNMHVGTINKTGGTFTHGSNTVVVDPTSNQTLTITDSFSTIRIEDSSETGLERYYKLDAQTGTTARDVSDNASNGTLNNYPRWQNSTYTDGGGTAATARTSIFDNAGWLVFSGDSNVSFSVGNYNPISISAWFYITASGTGNPRIVNLPYFRLYVTTGDKLGAYADWGTNDGNWQSTTTFSRNAWHHVVVTYDGSDPNNVPVIYLDNSALTLSTVSGPPSGTYGSTGTGYIGNSPGLGDDFAGAIDDVRIYSVILSSGEITQLASGLHPGDLGGTATVTLGANLSAGLFRVDDGTLAGSSFTMTATSSCYLNGGALTIGSAAFTCTNGMTTRYGTTLTMGTAGGVLKIGNGNTFTMDGTLVASNSPTIQNNGSGTYTFTVGSSSTARPALNINGLAVKHTDVNGMNIDSVAGSSTTFTRFDSVAFSSSSTTANATQLQMTEGTLYLPSNGCSFDATGMTGTYSNVKLTGNGTSGGETRAVFGSATCKNTSGSTVSCETLDSDDDNSPVDGVGDTVATNGAVVQFTYGAYSEFGSGTIAGYPTPSFDWSTYSYWKTYVAFNNVTSGVHRLYARAQDGSDAGYYWQIPSGKGQFMGTVRWDTESGVHYVYVLTDLGWVYKVRDYGSSGAGGFKSIDDASPPAGVWKYQQGSGATATAPAAMDPTNIFWVGLDSSANGKVFALSRSTGTTSITPYAEGTTVTTAPALAVVGGTTYFFVARSDGGINVATATLGGLWSVGGSAAVTGPMMYYQSAGLIYGNASGQVRVRDKDLNSIWTYTNANASACGALYYDELTRRVFYGDAVGKMYAIVRSGSTSSGAVLSSNYPYQPSNTTSSSDSITVAPVYVGGVVAYGTSTGKVVFIDAQNGSSQPALIQMYHFGSAVSSIAYVTISATLGNFMIGTSDGHMHFLRRDTSDSTTMRDPTSGTQ